MGNPQDLRVTTLSTTTLHPSEPTERRFMFLSNIDQVLNFSMEVLQFFRANAKFPVDVVVERLRSAVEMVLVPYDYLAGRLRLNKTKGRMEIDCNSGGVTFVVASSALELGEVEEIQCQIYPAAFQQLVTVVGGGGLRDDQPICAFQVTTFKCGGFALGISRNHSVFDGLSMCFFLKNLAALASGEPLAVQPNNDRLLLAARDPPCVEYPHQELLNLDARPSTDKYDGRATDTARSTALEFKVFRLDADKISALKAKAKADCGGEPLDPRAITTFNVVVAHLWRCKALAANLADTSTLLFAADTRKRLVPALVPSYTGNAVISAYAAAARSDLEAVPFASTVGIVRAAAARLTNDYIRGFMAHGDMMVTSWLTLGFEEMEYPWGRPAYSCPVPQPNKDLILLFPSIEGPAKGVNVQIGLQKGDLDKFETLFYQIFQE